MEAQQSPPEDVGRALDEAAALLGGRASFGQMLSPPVRASAIGNWKTRGVPLEYCPQIERLTAGRITRRDLRPLDYHLIWPELADPDQVARAPQAGECQAELPFPRRLCAPQPAPAGSNEGALRA